jgi:hypothetical protein
MYGGAFEVKSFISIVSETARYFFKRNRESLIVVCPHFTNPSGKQSAAAR